MPALDGVRAMAVAAVLLYHGDVSWARGGYLGVDAFFVLSGFLITTLLVLEWRRRAGIGLLAFWGRRARRLLPALLLMMLAVAVFIQSRAREGTHTSRLVGLGSRSLADSMNILAPV